MNGMTTYYVRVSDEEMEPSEDGDATWSAVLYEQLSDGTQSEAIRVGMGLTAREALSEI